MNSTKLKQDFAPLLETTTVRGKERIFLPLGKELQYLADNKIITLEEKITGKETGLSDYSYRVNPTKYSQYLKVKYYYDIGKFAKEKETEHHEKLSEELTGEEIWGN